MKVVTVSEEIKKHWTEYEKRVCAGYQEILVECLRQVKQLDAQTSYYPILELHEMGTPGRFGIEQFQRGFVMHPRKWEEASTAQLKAKVKQYSQLAQQYANRIVELQEIIGRRE